jgi:hypothetical protein
VTNTIHGIPPTSEQKDKFVEAVRSLDRFTTADEVRDLLIQHGITGRPGECHTCPIARWLAAQVGLDTWWVSVDGARCTLWTENIIGSWRELVKEWTPTAARYFINRFDGMDVTQDYSTDPAYCSYVPLLDREGVKR